MLAAVETRNLDGLLHLSRSFNASKVVIGIKQAKAPKRFYYRVDDDTY